MARSPTARVEFSKKAYTETVTALLALLALLKAAGKKAGFTLPDQDEETDEDEDADEDEDEDEDEDDEDGDKKKKSSKKSKDKEDDEDEDEDEDADDEDEDEDEDDEDEDEDEDEESLSASDLKKVKAVLQKVLDTAGRKEGVSLLTKYKVEKVSDLKEGQVAAFIKSAEKVLTGAKKSSKKK
jgi:cobalamin biosynthesis protein CobT